MHGSFSRADTAIIGGAIGPDFRTEFLDPAPTSNGHRQDDGALLLGYYTDDGTLIYAGRVGTTCCARRSMSGCARTSRPNRCGASRKGDGSRH
jgi:hypothetical protein